MSLKNSPIVIKGERVRDDFSLLFRQRPLACIVIIIAIILLSCITVIEMFRNVPALKSKTAGLQSELAQIKQDRDSKATEFGEVRRKADATITGLKRDLSEVQRDSNARIQSLNSQMAERGKAQSDLAPWIALADSWYSNAPPDQRLDLLLKRVSELTNTVTGAGRDARAQTPRVLSAEAMARIRAKLNFLSLLSQQKMTVEIQSLGGDPESLALAGQIKTLFEGYGLEIKNGVQEAVREKPLNGLVLESNHPLEGGPLADAMFQLFKELDGPPAVLINPKLSDSQLIIEAGSNQ